MDQKSQVGCKFNTLQTCFSPSTERECIYREAHQDDHSIVSFEENRDLGLRLRLADLNGTETSIVQSILKYRNNVEDESWIGVHLQDLVRSVRRSYPNLTAKEMMCDFALFDFEY